MDKNRRKKKGARGRADSMRFAALVLTGLVFLIVLSGLALLKRTVTEPVATAEASDDTWDFGSWEDDDGDWDEEDGEDEGWDEALDAFSADDFSGFGDVDDDFEGFAGEGWNDDGLLGGLLTASDGDLVVAEFEGGVLTLGEVVGPYNDMIAGSALLFGEDDGTDMLEEVMSQLVAEKLCRIKAEEMGLTTLTEQDEAEIARLAQQEYDACAAAYRPALDLSGMTAEEADAAVAKYLQDELGITLESIAAEQRESYWKTKLFDAVTADVTVTDDEVRSAYDEKVAAQKEAFEAYPDDYEYALDNGETIAYNLPGYRRIKHILLGFDDDDTAAKVEAAYDEIARAQAEGAEVDVLLAMQAELDQLYAAQDAEAAQVMAELEAGADFDQLIEKYGDDPNMAVEPWKTRGYVVGAGSTYPYSQDFIDACLTLESPGQVSMPAHSVGGVHIIRYLGDTQSGAVPLEDIRGAIEAEALDDKRGQAFAEVEAGWIAAANVKLYPERLQ